MILWTKHTCPECDGAGFVGWSRGSKDTCPECGGLGAWQTAEINEEPEEEREICTGALRP